MEKYIKKAKTIYSKWKEAEKEWDIFYKNNTFNRAFWKIDKKIIKLKKEANSLPYNTYPIQTTDDLLGYFEFHELNLLNHN